MACCARCFGELSALAVFCPQCGHPQEPDFAQLLNCTVGDRYQIYRRLSKGGLSTVFVALDLQTDRTVVVKVSDPGQLVRRELTYSITPEAARAYWAEMLERMRREAETLTAVEHPNIVRFYNAGAINDDLRYVVMELLRGRTLREAIEASAGLPLADALQIALEVTAALREVHARGIVHRDLNPRNIMLVEMAEHVSPGGEAAANPQSAIRNPQSAVKVIDFGIAKFPQPPGAPPFTQHAVLTGTVAYASPEQCQNLPLDGRTDIYSLGVVLYEMVTGQRPFFGRTPTEIALNHIQAAPPPPRALNPELPASLEAVILRALQKYPAARQQSAEEFAAELRAIAHRIVVPVQAPADELALLPPQAKDEAAAAAMAATSFFPAESGEPEPERRPRRKLALAAIAASLLLIITALLYGENLWARRAPQLAAKQMTNKLPAPTPLSPSEADALELAGQLPADQLRKPAPPVNSPSSAPANSPAARDVKSPATLADKTARPSALPQSRPQTPTPAPAVPAIIVAPPRATPPVSQPDIAHTSPRPTPPPVVPAMRPRIKTPPAEEAAAPADEQTATLSDPEDSGTPNNRNGRPGVWRPRPDLPPVENNGRTRTEEAEDVQQFGPKIFAWSGRVNYERTITLELPGGPGAVEIPRTYRKRVGIVEPPNADNQWRCVVLRIFGRGETSIIVRWWPATRRVARVIW